MSPGTAHLHLNLCPGNTRSHTPFPPSFSPYNFSQSAPLLTLRLAHQQHHHKLDLVPTRLSISAQTMSPMAEPQRVPDPFIHPPTTSIQSDRNPHLHTPPPVFKPSPHPLLRTCRRQPPSSTPRQSSSSLNTKQQQTSTAKQPSTPPCLYTPFNATPHPSTVPAVASARCPSSPSTPALQRTSGPRQQVY